MNQKDPRLELANKLKSENCPGVSFPVIHMIVRSAWDLAVKAERQRIMGQLKSWHAGDITLFEIIGPFGIRFVEDPSIPENEAHLHDKDGACLLKVKGINKAEGA